MVIIDDMRHYVPKRLNLIPPTRPGSRPKPTPKGLERLPEGFIKEQEPSIDLSEIEIPEYEPEIPEGTEKMPKKYRR